MTRPRHQAGFTLVEMLVAMTIGTVVLLAAAAMLGRGGSDYQRIGGNIGGERESRALITVLAEDLKATRHHPEARYERSTADWPQDRLGLLTLQPADAQADTERLGDLCAVHYHLQDLTINGKIVRCLMRGQRDSRETFASIARKDFSGVFDPTARDEPLAFGVLSFEARPRVRDPQGKWQDWSLDRHPTTAPEALAVRVVLARRETVPKLTTSAAWDGGGRTAKLLGTADAADRNRHLEVVTALLPLNPGPPLPQDAKSR